MFIENFSSTEDVIKEYQAPADALKGAVVHLAWYGYGDYSGDSLVIFERGGKLFEVNGSHCSCNGLEEQWKPEETSWEALAMRKIGSYCDENHAGRNALAELVAKHVPSDDSDE